MLRKRFIIGALSVPALAFAWSKSGVARAQDEFDPATSAASPSLRVLLGAGDAVPTEGGGFTFGGRRYRGTFSRLPDGSVINTLPLEEYLYSVVPREMPPSWPAAALEAQAICARTYVLQRSNPARVYDLVPSELDQVYGGTAGETVTARTAIDASAGVALRFAGAFAQVMYSSCCGGHTEASSDAWGGTPFPYLQGIECKYCTASPDYRWERAIDLVNVERAFARELGEFGALQNVRIAQTDQSGRIRTVELAAERGSAFVKGSAFRLRVGSRVIPSLLVTRLDAPPGVPRRIAVLGGGLGHGVGLCQWGARGFAQAGATAREILALYFPGTVTA